MVLDDRLEEGQDLLLDTHVEGRGGLVGEQHVGPAAEGHRDDDPLAHAARQLVRIAAQHPVDVGQPDLTQSGANTVGPRPLIPPGGVPSGQGHLAPDRHHRVEGRNRLLEHHRDIPASQVAPAPLGRPHELLTPVPDGALDVAARAGAR